MYCNKEFSQITIEEINLIIKNIKTDSPEEDLLISKCLKHLPDNIIKNISEIFNVSINSGFIPDCLKESRITMIEKGDKMDIKKYHPISCTPILSILFEKIIAGRLLSHFEKNHIIVNQQSGFRAKSNTKDNLFFLNEKSLNRFSLG